MSNPYNDFLGLNSGCANYGGQAYGMRNASAEPKIPSPQDVRKARDAQRIARVGTIVKDARRKIVASIRDGSLVIGSPDNTPTELAEAGAILVKELTDAGWEAGYARMTGSVYWSEPPTVAEAP